MRRTVAITVAVVSVAIAAVLWVQGPQTGRSAIAAGTPDPLLCASPVAQSAAGPATVDAADAETSPLAGEPGTPVVSESCVGTPRAVSTRIEIALSEFAFTPNEITIPANTDVEIVLTNVGSATHSLNVDGNNNPSDPGIHSGNLDGGESATMTMTINLPAGDWFVYCDIMGHHELGMDGTIRAR